MWFYSHAKELIEAAYILSIHKSKKKAKKKIKEEKVTQFILFFFSNINAIEKTKSTNRTKCTN
jgi:predicted nucleic acid-binding protein